MNQPGRVCPIHYRYLPAALCRTPIPWEANTLFVAGGLYGNPVALDALQGLVREDSDRAGPVTQVFNGDFNWFDIDSGAFADINSRVLNHLAIQGNVELELASPSPGTGCGCAYPDRVDATTVERSNRIMARLQQTARHHPQLLARLATLPRYLCLRAGAVTILILHGDPESLADWGLAREQLADPGHRKVLAAWFEATGADIIACTHTCEPAIWRGVVGGRERVVINNGATGLGNGPGDPRGLVTRISRTGAHPDRLVSVSAHGLDISLVPVDFDLSRWLTLFDRWWPQGSDAASSYRHRICQGISLNSQPKNVFSSLLF